MTRCWAIVCVLGLMAGVVQAADGLRAGAATSNITPEIGLDVIGGFRPYPSRHVHDELHARCLVLENGSDKLAIVVCDLLGIHRIVSDEARRIIAERNGIPRECVLISATHTHSASSAMGQDRLIAEPQLDDYQKFVARRIADGVARALNNCQPAELAFGKVEVPEHLFNRRWFMQPGTVPPNPFGGTDKVKMNPPAGSPNLVEPAGPTDPEVSVIAVRTPAGKPIAVLSAYSLHYVGGVGSADISADYYGAYCEALARKVAGEPSDPSFVALMANGTSGDINNINFKNPRGRKQPYEQIQFVAEDVAQKVAAILPGLKYSADVPLKARYREPRLRYRRPTDEERAWAEKTLAAGPKSVQDLSYIYAQRAMRLVDYPEDTIVPLQVLRIGDVCIGTMPCEVFCEIGLEFKKKSPQQPAFLIELAHGYLGYLPSPRHFALGGYETWLGTNRLEPEASTRMLEHLLEMAAEVRSP